MCKCQTTVLLHSAFDSKTCIACQLRLDRKTTWRRLLEFKLSLIDWDSMDFDLSCGSRHACMQVFLIVCIPNVSILFDGSDTLCHSVHADQLNLEYCLMPVTANSGILCKETLSTSLTRIRVYLSQDAHICGIAKAALFEVMRCLLRHTNFTTFKLSSAWKPPARNNISSSENCSSMVSSRRVHLAGKYLREVVPQTACCLGKNIVSRGCFRTGQQIWPTKFRSRGNDAISPPHCRLCSHEQRFSGHTSFGSRQRQTRSFSCWVQQSLSVCDKKGEFQISLFAKERVSNEDTNEKTMQACKLAWYNNLPIIPGDGQKAHSANPRTPSPPANVHIWKYYFVLGKKASGLGTHWGSFSKPRPTRFIQPWFGIRKVPSWSGHTRTTSASLLTPSWFDASSTFRNQTRHWSSFRTELKSKTTMDSSISRPSDSANITWPRRVCLRGAASPSEQTKPTALCLINSDSLVTSDSRTNSARNNVLIPCLLHVHAVPSHTGGEFQRDSFFDRCGAIVTFRLAHRTDSLKLSDVSREPSLSAQVLPWALWRLFLSSESFVPPPRTCTRKATNKKTFCVKIWECGTIISLWAWIAGIAVINLTSIIRDIDDSRWSSRQLVVWRINHLSRFCFHNLGSGVRVLWLHFCHSDRLD